VLACLLAGADSGSRRVRARLAVLAVGFVVAWCGSLVALPEVADAQNVAADCPGAFELDAYAGTDDAASELRQLRLEVAASIAQMCGAVRDQAHADAVQLHDDLVALQAALTDAPLPVDPGGRTIEVSNPPDLTPLQTTAATSLDTSHSDLWGLAGFFTGAGFLVVLYRILRGEA
jgi:hypothetical protein